MGAALKRPIKNYNVEKRAFKVMEEAQKAAKPAPRYPTEAARLARQEATKLYDLENKIPDLDERLKHVYVQSEGDNPIIDESTTRPLPTERRRLGHEDYGYLEPISIPVGRLSLKQAVAMLTSHKDDPKQHTVDNLADKYKMDPLITAKILEYFHPFKAFLPQDPDNLVPKTLPPSMRARQLKQAQKLIDQANKILEEDEKKRLK